MSIVIKSRLLEAALLALFALGPAPPATAAAENALSADVYALGDPADGPLDDVERSLSSARGLSRRPAQIARDAQLRLDPAPSSVPVWQLVMARSPPSVNLSSLLIMCGSTSCCATTLPPPQSA